jgi:hypothetical protein
VVEPDIGAPTIARGLISKGREIAFPPQFEGLVSGATAVFADEDGVDEDGMVDPDAEALAVGFILSRFGDGVAFVLGEAEGFVLGAMIVFRKRGRMIVVPDVGFIC